MKITLIPRNGLGNRLQAITSAILLARDIGAEIEILWGEELLLPLAAEEVFSTPTMLNFFKIYTESQISSLLNEIPEFLCIQKDNDEITLRGNRSGEQKFMPRIWKLLNSDKSLRQLTIVAGGQFEINRKRNSRSQVNKFQKRRHQIYRELEFSQEICSDTGRALESLERPYIGLHLRGTDRADQSISDKLLVRTCLRQIEKENIKSLLIVGDSSERITKVAQLFQSKGVAPQLSPVSNLTRTSIVGARMAIVDWTLLKNAELIIASENSTFAVEASVAGGIYGKSIFLRPNLPKRARIHLRERIVLFRKFGQIRF